MAKNFVFTCVEVGTSISGGLSLHFTSDELLNLLECKCKGNSATSTNTKLVNWPLMGGL